MGRTSALAVSAFTILAACTPSSTPSSNASASGPTPACTFAPVQTSNDVRMNCPVSGALANLMIDPAHPGSTACTRTTFSLFSQTMSANVAVIYGENGDENAERVRLGATISGGTHHGSLAKSAYPDCGSIVGPTVPVDTSFSGRHIALIDKSQTPACVFQSRLTLSMFNQTIGAGLTPLPGLPVGAVTRSAVEDLVGKRLDLQLASSVAGLLHPGVNTSEPGFVGRSGRCANFYQAFTGN
jgi:hypothetical protein